MVCDRFCVGSDFSFNFCFYFYVLLLRGLCRLMVCQWLDRGCAQAPWASRFAFSAVGSVCRKESTFKIQVVLKSALALTFQWDLSPVLQASIALGLARSMWLCWLLSGLHWVCAHPQPSICLPQSRHGLTCWAHHLYWCCCWMWHNQPLQIKWVPFDPQLWWSSCCFLP